MDDSKDGFVSFKEYSQSKEIKGQAEVFLPALSVNASGFLLRGVCRSIKEQVLYEIQAALDAEENRQKFLPLETVGWLIRQEKLYPYLDSEAINEIESFLRGEARRNRGEKKDRAFIRQMHVGRAYLFVQFYEETGSNSAAYERLARREKLSDVCNLRKSVKKGLQYQEEDCLAKGMKEPSLKTLLSEYRNISKAKQRA